MRLQQPIQEVGIHSRYLGDAKFHEEYDYKKNIWPPKLKFDGF